MNQKVLIEEVNTESLISLLRQHHVVTSEQHLSDI